MEKIIPFERERDAKNAGCGRMCIRSSCLVAGDVIDDVQFSLREHPFAL
jgi:hypothetical protein